MDRPHMLAVVMVAALVAVRVARPAEEEQEAGERTVQANALIQQGSHKEAADILEALLREAPPDSPDVPGWLGSLRRACDGAWAGARFPDAVQAQIGRLDGSGLTEEVERDLRRALLLQLGQFYYDHHQSLGALRAYEGVRELSDPGGPSGVEERLAELYEDTGYVEKALSVREALLKGAPDNAWLRRRTARLLFRLGRTEEGLQLAGAERDPGVLRQTAQELYDARLLTAAEELARQAADRDADARLLLAEILRDQKKFDDAVAILEDSLRREQGDSADDWTLFRAAECLADVHLHRKTLDQAIADASARLLETPEENVLERRKLYAILCELHRANENPAGAAGSIRLYRELCDDKAQADRAVARVCGPALRDLLRADRLSIAQKLIRNLCADGVRGEWLDAAQYRLQLCVGNPNEAEDTMARLENAAGADEAKLLALAAELSEWGEDDVCERLYERILQTPPHNSACDANAHVQLGKVRFGEHDYAGAIAHFDAVDASLTDARMGLTNEDAFRRLEVLARYHAAGDDPDEIVRWLDDPRQARALAAAELLRAHGLPAQVPAMERAAATASPRVRTALSEAITDIRARDLSSPVGGALGGGDVPEQLAALGPVRWLQNDPYDEAAVWAAIEGRFVAMADPDTAQVHGFADAIAPLAGAVPEARCIAFTREAVWVGTDRGLFAFHRELKQWNSYAVAGRHAGAPILELDVRFRMVRVRAEAEGRARTWLLNPRTGEWKEQEPGTAQ